jgi:hypothetical protein
LREAQALGGEVLLLVIDRVARAQLKAGLALLRAARGGDHRGAESARELDRRDAYAARAALHEQGFAGLQATTVEHVAPHGEKRLGQGGRLRVAQALGHGQALRHGRDAVFSVAPTGDQGAHAVAHFETRFGQRGGVTRFDHACDFEARQIGRAGRRRVMPFALQHVGPVDTARTHMDQRLARPRLGLRTFGQTQHFRLAKRGNFYDTHTKTIAILYG